MLVDPRYYYGGDKQDVMLGSSEHFRFRSNRMAFRASLRVGGREAIEAPIYLKDGVNQVSPFVELDDGAATT